MLQLSFCILLPVCLLLIGPFCHLPDPCSRSFLLLSLCSSSGTVTTLSCLLFRLGLRLLLASCPGSRSLDYAGQACPGLVSILSSLWSWLPHPCSALRPSGLPPAPWLPMFVK
ncbi:hypothetical protein NQD34_015983 [Periophthalmus magnuspinnatus]|nr:hypothetical protein NQD34_015983 [Periophthalmus magnuspinnatus]